MGERVTQFANGVTLPVANTALLVVAGPIVQNATLSALPTVSPATARQVHIRGSVTVTAATGGAVTVNVYRGNAITGTLIGTFTGASGAVNTIQPFELVDTAPVNGLQYCIAQSTTTTPGTGNVIAEVEEVI